MLHNNKQQFLGLVVSVFFCLGFVGTPAAVQAQGTSDDEQYRAVLLALVETLQAQIALLQEQRTVPKSIMAHVEEETSVQLGTVDRDVSVLHKYTLTNESDVQNILDPEHRRYLARIYDVFPDVYDQKLSEFVIFSEAEGNYEAFVQTIPPEHDQWSFAISADLLGREDRESNTALLVHELSHIISYESIAGVSLPKSASCHEYFQVNGCPKANSYLAVFVDTFWDTTDLDRAVRFTQTADTIGAADEYFQSTENQYLNGYAALNPEEDFAESFAQYALSRESQMSTIASQKVWWFDQFSDLQDIRQSVQ